MRLHPTLIWTRNNFFILAHTGLLAFVSSKSFQSEDAVHLRFLAFAGFFMAVIWLWVNIAGRVLQRRWKRVVSQFEADLFATVGSEPRIQGPFSNLQATTREGTSWLVSISSALILLAAGFVAVWAYLLFVVF